MLGWIITSLAILGTILVTSQKRKVRLSAFFIWILTNSFWAYYAIDPALRVQFLIYLGITFLGIRNNWREKVA